MVDQLNLSKKLIDSLHREIEDKQLNFYQHFEDIQNEFKQNSNHLENYSNKFINDKEINLYSLLTIGILGIIILLILLVVYFVQRLLKKRQRNLTNHAEQLLTQVKEPIARSQTF